MKFKLIDNLEYWGSGGGDHWTVQVLVIFVDEQFSANSTDGNYLCWWTIFCKHGIRNLVWGRMAADENGGGGLTLQVRLAASLAAAGPLQCRYTRPPFNGAAALKCFFLSSSFLFSSCLVLNKNKNDTELQFSNCILIRWCCWYMVALIGRDFIKVLRLVIQSFAVSIEKLGSVFWEIRWNI